MARLSLPRLSLPRLSLRRSSKKSDSATLREEHLRKHAVVTLQEMKENWEAARSSISPLLEDWVESATSEPVKCARAALAELICSVHPEVDENQLLVPEDLCLTEQSTPLGYDKSIFMFLDALPDGLRVSGKLSVQNCYSLEELPKNLEVGGDFLIQSCNQIERLPAELVVEGALIVKHCSKLLDIGQNLIVKETLQLFDVASLEQLPDEAKFEGSIEIKHCPNLMRFEPHTLVVNGNLELVNIPKLAALPEGLTVEGDFNVSNLPIRSFPKGLTVKGFYLSATHCDSLEIFPPDFYFDGCVDLRYCTSLYMVPDGLTILSDLILAGCSSLSYVPENMDVAHHFDLSACDALTAFPTNIRVGGRLTMENCESIISFGPLEEPLDNMEANQADAETETQNSFVVGMDFSLERCTSLKALPQNLVVEGNFSLKMCSALTSLPSGLSVRGNLQLEDCSQLSSIPSEILAWPEPRHDIYIGGTGLSQETLDWLRSANTRNVRFHVNLLRRSSQLEEPEHFHSLEKVLVFWMNELETIPSGVIRPDLHPLAQRTALRFFSKLRGAKEFGITETRSVLAKRVLRAWELLLDPECQDEVVQRMEDSLDACDDKPIWALNQLTLVDLVFKARGNREALRELGLRVMRLMIVHEHVERKIQSLSWVDDVCVYLRFEIELRDSLELPVEATDMIFKSYIAVEDEELQAAEKAALSISDDEFEAWLETWPEWLRQDRYEVAQSLHWEDLPMVKSTLVVPNTDLSGFLMNDPVILRKQVWSLHDVLMHWIRTGLDLMNSPLSEKHILNLQRVAVPKRRSLRRSLRRLLHSVKSL